MLPPLARPSTSTQSLSAIWWKISYLLLQLQKPCPVSKPCYLGWNYLYKYLTLINVYPIPVSHACKLNCWVRPVRALHALTTSGLDYLHKLLKISAGVLHRYVGEWHLYF